jgi:hypothetical protein
VATGSRVELSEDLAALAATIAKEQGVGKGEAVKQALALMRYLQDQAREGATIEIRKGTETKKLELR